MKPVLSNTCRAVAEYLHASPQQIQGIVRSARGPVSETGNWLPRLAKSIRLLVPSEMREDPGVLRATCSLLFAVMAEGYEKGHCPDPHSLPAGEIYTTWVTAWQSRLPTGDPELDRVVGEIEHLPSILHDPHQDELLKLIAKLSHGAWTAFPVRCAADHLGVSPQKVADLLQELRTSGHVESNSLNRTRTLYRVSAKVACGVAK